MGEATLQLWFTMSKSQLQSAKMFASGVHIIPTIPAMKMRLVCEAQRGIYLQVIKSIS